MDTEMMMRRLSRTSPMGRSFGPVYEKGDVLVIPVAFVAGGGGMGQTEGSEELKPHSPPPGFGGGSGGVSIPLGVYEVKGDSVRFVPAFDLTLIVLATIGLIRLLARKHSKHTHRGGGDR